MQSLGRRTVVLLPQGKDGVGIRVEFPETFYQTRCYSPQKRDRLDDGKIKREKASLGF